MLPFTLILLALDTLESGVAHTVSREVYGYGAVEQYRYVITWPASSSATGTAGLTGSFVFSGGTQPFSYLWSNGDTTEDISGLIGGIYSVTINDGSNCATVVTFTINQSIILDDATYSYSESTYCQSDSDPVAVITGTTEGVFTSNVELNISESTGEIDLISSSPGTYGVLYTTSGTCPDTLTQFISIIDLYFCLTLISISKFKKWVKLLINSFLVAFVL